MNRRVFLCSFLLAAFCVTGLFGQEPKKQQVILIFSAAWCGPCQDMKRNTWPILKKDGTLNSYEVYEIDVDKDKKYSKLFNVTSMPTVVLCKYDTDGETILEISRFEGARSASEVKQWLKNKVVHIPGKPIQKIYKWRKNKKNR